MSLIPWKNKRSSEGREHADSPLVQFRSEMDRLMESFFRDPWSISQRGMLSDWMPSIDLAEDDSQVTVKVEVPGIDPKDIEISVSGNRLTIEGEKSEEREDEGKEYYHSERRFGSFRRTMELPRTVDLENLNADYKNGVLTITARKTGDTTRRKIPIYSR